MTNDKSVLWNRYVDFVISAYNDSVHTPTQFSPNFLLFWRHLMQPVNAIFGFEHAFKETKGWKGWDNLMKERVELREKSLSIAHHNNLAMQQKTSKASEGKGETAALNIGDRCAIAVSKKKKKENPPWEIDFKIVEKITPSTYVVQKISNGQKMIVNRRRVKLVNEPHFPSTTHAVGDNLEVSAKNLHPRADDTRESSADLTPSNNASWGPSKQQQQTQKQKQKQQRKQTKPPNHRQQQQQRQKQQQKQQQQPQQHHQQQQEQQQQQQNLPSISSRANSKKKVALKFVGDQETIAMEPNVIVSLKDGICRKWH